MTEEYFQTAEKFADFDLWMTRQGHHYDAQAIAVSVLISIALDLSVTDPVDADAWWLTASVVREYKERGLNNYPVNVQIGHLGQRLASIAKFWRRSETEETD